jgi:hypothetical protein
MDDTLCSLIGPSISLVLSMFGKQLKLPAYGKYFGWFHGQLTDAERAELLLHVYRPEFYLNLPSNFASMHGLSVKSISQCAHHHYRKVKIITSRGHALGDKAVDTTRAWLKLHEFENADTISIDTPDHSVCKTSFCTQYPTVMVDDNVQVAEAFGKDDRHKVILIDQHWNHGHPRYPYVTRVPTRRLTEAIVNNAE